MGRCLEEAWWFHDDGEGLVTKKARKDLTCRAREKESRG